MMRHAYLITAHTNWKLLNLLIQTLDKKENDFFLLVDLKTKAPLNDLIYVKPAYSRLIEVPRIEINWGGYSQIQAEINLLDVAVKGEYDYYHFLQGSDFPLKSSTQIDDFFEANRGKEFIQFAPSEYNFAKWKCCYDHILVENRFYRNSKILKAISHIWVNIQKKINLEKKLPKLYHGSALFSITHKCALYVLEQRKTIEQLFRRTIAADEVFLQTIIMQSPFKESVYHFEKADGNVRYIDWEHRNGNSPKILNLDDFEILKNLPEQYCFARKITDSNIELAERIVNAFEDNNEQATN